MRITANQIESWANTRNAQSELPILIRRLIFAASQLTELSVPGGESIYRPGWDGYVNATSNIPWVPDGVSCWEIGCDKSIWSKAEKDFNKRVKELNAHYRSNHEYVFVTPRRWQKKSIWLEEKNKLAVWKSVHVIDADDLETWLEQVPSVSLAFSEKLGLSGYGIESVDKYWQNWSEQTRLHITPSAILTERDDAKKVFLNQIQESNSLITIEADSREEAIAFASATLLDNSLKERAVCITLMYH